MTLREQAITILNELIAMNNRSTIAGQIGKAVDLLNQDEPIEIQQVIAKPEKD